MDDYLDAQEASIDKLYAEGGNQDRCDMSEVNYESMLSREIEMQRDLVGATLAEKVSRGKEAVQVAKLDWLKYQRLVKAGKAKIQLLQNRYEADKVNARLESKITR